MIHEGTQVRTPAARTYISRFLAASRAAPRLTKDEEYRLVREVRKGRSDAIQTLIESNMGFVMKVAGEYTSLGLPLEDLLSEGNLGLLEAARRFDGAKGTRFMTYAIWWIRKAILQAVSQRSRMVRMPDLQMQQLRDIRRAEAELRTSLGRDPTREETAEQLSMTLKAIDRVLQRGAHEVSLDKKVGENEDTPLVDLLRDVGGVCSERQLLDREMRHLVSEAFKKLSRQQRNILHLRLGLGGQERLTLEKVGTRLRISRERVRQIELRAKEDLRDAIARAQRI